MVLVSTLPAPRTREWLQIQWLRHMVLDRVIILTKEYVDLR